MSTANRYYAGTTVSRYLSPDGRSWAGVLFQSGKPVLDAELQLEQDAAGHLVSQVQSVYLPSGWMRPQGSNGGQGDYIVIPPGGMSPVTNAFDLPAATVMVAGYPVRFEFANTTTPGRSRVLLTAPPVLGGAPPDVKRTDFVFLEVWLALVAPSPRASGTVTVLPALPVPGDTVVLNGIPLTAVAAAPGVDQFAVGVDEFTTASNIAVAINDPLNSFDTFVTASSGGTDTVTIKAVVPGAAGNLITLSTTGGALIPSGATLAGGADRPNKPTQSTVYRNGCVQAPGPVNLPDDLADPVIDAETTQRVQLQWRIRVTGQAEAVNFKTQPLGFQNPNVVAQGTQVAPVVGYPFVPADGSTVSGGSSAIAYRQVDSGLWVAGDGSSASALALGTADGFVYAVPMAMVFRRNDAFLGGAGVGFDPLNNTNGALPFGHGAFANPAVGAIPPNVSDRPDGLFCDAIVLDDILDLRRSVVPTGVDLSSELVRQVQRLMDGGNRTWAVDGGDKNVLGAGSGDVSTRYLVCNQIGRDNAHGGAIPTSGDTTRGTTIRNFDHVARRFGAQQFNAGGHVLHTAYWESLTPDYKEPSKALVAAIERDFGSWDAFRSQMKESTVKVRGSGWGVLVLTPAGMRVLTVMNHENGVMWDGSILLPIDAWEHAYYLDYQNDRAAHFDAVFDNLVDWSAVERRLKVSRGEGKTAREYKMPRKFDRKHCNSKTCDEMGFSEKASCRPYKNCYKSAALRVVNLWLRS